MCPVNAQAHKTLLLRLVCNVVGGAEWKRRILSHRIKYITIAPVSHLYLRVPLHPPPSPLEDVL